MGCVRSCGRRSERLLVKIGSNSFRFVVKAFCLEFSSSKFVSGTLSIVRERSPTLSLSLSLTLTHSLLEALVAEETGARL